MIKQRSLTASMLLLATLTTLFLSACGGGGSGGSTQPSTTTAEPTQITASNWQTTQVLSRQRNAQMQIELIGSELFIKITNIDINDGKHTQVYLDTDNNAQTGYRFDNQAWAQTGVDYIIEDGHLFHSIANNSTWSWNTDVGEIGYVRKPQSIEITIDISLLEGLCNTLNAGVMSRDQDWNIESFYPVSSRMKAYTVSSCSHTEDTTPPEISLNGANPMHLPLNATFNDPGAIATDNIDGDISADIEVSSDVDTSNPGSYSVGYKVSDTSGNTSQVKRTVIVDTTIKQVIIIDGNPDDWAAIQPLAQTKQGVLKVFDDENKIYLLIEASKVGKNTQFFLDSDNNPQTGFQLRDQAWQGGADYMIENRFLGKTISNTFQWAWDFKLPSPTEHAKTRGIVEVAVNKSDLKSLSNTISIGYISRDENWDINYILPENSLSSYPLQHPGVVDFVIANDDSATTNSSKKIEISVLLNDISHENSPLSISSFTQPVNGNIKISGADTRDIVYEANINFVGTDSFSYEITDEHGHKDSAIVSIIVTEPPNFLPEAQDDSAKTVASQPISINVLENDIDPDGDSLIITSFTQPLNGIVKSTGNGLFTYTAASGFAGLDSFTYRIKDGNGGNSGATVNITVEQTPNSAPDAVEDAPGTDNTQAITINVLDNDTDLDGDTLTVVSITQPPVGTAILNNDDTVLFDPQGNVGSITFTYTISDNRGGTDSATVTVSSSDPNDGNDHFPVINGENVNTSINTAIFIDVLANDTDADGDILILDQVDNGAHGTTSKVNGGVLYTPDPGFTGTDSFFYGVHDGHGHNGAGLVEITVTQ